MKEKVACPLFDSRPTFFGVLRATDEGTVIEGYFAYSWIGRVFLLFGFAFLMLLTVALAVFAAGVYLSYKSFGSCQLTAICLLAAGLMFWLTTRASQPLRQEEIEWISTRLCQEPRSNLTRRLSRLRD